MVRKIGMIGGTFNPVHYAHLFIASQAKECFNLDRVIFVPCSQPPHKKVQLADAEDRYRMVLLATRHNPDFVVSSAELERGGKSYSIETVAEFRKKYGSDTEVYFIIGMDSLVELSTWKDSDELIKSCQFIVAVRPGWEWKNSRQNHVRCHLMKTPGLEISSADIRNRVRCGGSVKYLLPDVVERYIHDHGLYRLNGS